jgi:hypothetical protein
MSGKASKNNNNNSSNGGCSGNNSGRGGSSNGSGGGGGRYSEPQIVTGHQYHMYSQGSGGDRYVYIGKDDDGEPEFLDYGPKGGR